MWETVLLVGSLSGTVPFLAWIVLRLYFKEKLRFMEQLAEVSSKSLEPKQYNVVQ